MRRLFFVVTVVCLSALTFTSVMAQSPVGVRAVGVEAGWVGPEDLDATWGISAFFDIGMPVTNLYLQPFVDYWSQSIELMANTDLTFTDWAIGGKLKYVIPTSMPTWKPFIGAGAAAHLLDMGISETRIGYHMGGGMSFGVHDQVQLITEAWYSMVEDFNQTTVKAGIALTM